MGNNQGGNMDGGLNFGVFGVDPAMIAAAEVTAEQLRYDVS